MPFEIRVMCLQSFLTEKQRSELTREIGAIQRNCELRSQVPSSHVWISRPGNSKYASCYPMSQMRDMGHPPMEFSRICGFVHAIPFRVGAQYCLKLRVTSSPLNRKGSHGRENVLVQKPHLCNLGHWPGHNRSHFDHVLVAFGSCSPNRPSLS